MRIFLTLICLGMAALAGFTFTLPTDGIKPEMVLPMQIFFGATGLAALLTIPIVWGWEGVRTAAVLVSAVAVMAVYAIVGPDMLENLHVSLPIAALMVPVMAWLAFRQP